MSLAGTTVDATTQEDFHTRMVLLGAGFFGCRPAHGAGSRKE